MMRDGRRAGLVSARKNIPKERGHAYIYAHPRTSEISMSFDMW